jgi:putative nucleotidyltransferase with HDIG domain
MVKRMRALASHAASPWLPLHYTLVVGGGLFLLGWNLPALAGSSWILMILWVALIVAADAAPLPLPGGGYITVSSPLDYAGILIFGPVPVAVAEFTATLLLQVGTQRRPVYKALFNASAFAGTVLVTGWVFTTLGGVPGQALQFPTALVPILGMGVCYYALNTAIMSTILGLSQGRRVWQVWQVNYNWTMIHMMASLAFGTAIAVVYRSLGVWGIVLFIAPLLLARHTFKLYIDAKGDLIDFAKVLAGVIDEFDPYTCRHSQRVSRYAALLAREVGLSEGAVEQAETSGLLHDIGKIALSQRDLIVKPGPLTAAERARISMHADIGAEIVGRVRAFRKLAPLVRYHHERMDGCGYHRLPQGEVPFVARVVTVADAFDAMTSDRVYRKALSLDEALAELDRHAGAQFDGAVVSALCRLVARGDITIGEESLDYEPNAWPRAGVVNAEIV